MLIRPLHCSHMIDHNNLTVSLALSSRTILPMVCIGDDFFTSLQNNNKKISFCVLLWLSSKNRIVIFINPSAFTCENANKNIWMFVQENIFWGHCHYTECLNLDYMNPGGGWGGGKKKAMTVHLAHFITIPIQPLTVKTDEIHWQDIS